MNWRDIVRAHLPEITGDPARDEDIVEELADHLSLRFREARHAGASESEAVAIAVAELRRGTDLRQTIADADRARPVAPSTPPASGRLLQDVWADCRYAIRMLRRHSGFTTAALLTMGIGIGMTTAIFSVVQAVLLRPIPLPDADRLVMVWETDRSSGTIREPGSVPDFVDFRERSRELERLAGFGAYEATIQFASGEPTRTAALAVSPEFNAVLGIHPIAGRTFSPEEYQPRAAFAVLISERLWTALFARRPSAVGSAIRINERPATVVGVVRDAADFGILQILSAATARGFAARDARSRVDIWSPLQADPVTAPRDGHGLLMLGRLAPRRTVDAAQEELARIAADLERTHPSNRSRGVFVEPLQTVIFGRVQTPLAILMGAVLLVLVISWVNVANLLLARGASRMREVAVRTALGAPLARLLRQFAVENVVLTLLAAGLGLALAYATLLGVVAMAPAAIPRLDEAAIDGTVLALGLGLSVAVGLAFGFFALTQVRPNTPQLVLGAEDARGASPRSEGRLRSALVVVQVAMAVVSLSGAGLLIRSFWLIQQTNPGFDARGVLKAELSLPSARYPVDFRRAAPGYVEFNRLADDVLRRVSMLPTVEAAALAGSHPLNAGGTTSFEVVGREAEAERWPELPIRAVTPGYFAVTRVPHLRGRLLAATDRSTSGRVVVINEALAERFFQNADPLGQKLRFYGRSEWTIVGVVGDVRFHGITNAAPIAAYVLLAQVPVSSPALLVRTVGDPIGAAPAVRAAIRAIDPALAVFSMEPLADTLSQSVAQQRFLMLLLGLFAFVALTLAAIGVHGVLSYLVTQRTKEIGIRMSLGADARQVVHLVFGQGARLTATGLTAGIGLALVSSRWLAGLLYEITPTDAVTLGAVVLIIGIVGMLSTWLPARRAVRIDPLAALRHQ